MAPVPALFTLPIGATGGTFACTQPAPKVYLLTFTSPPDNRLVPDYNKAFLLALDIIEHKLPRGVVVTTSGIPKFYCNGLDFEAMTGLNFFQNSLYPVWRRLLTYPMPTIALIPGHAFAGALMLAVAHDYRIMNPSRGYLCLNEVDFGAPLRPAMAGLFRVKFPPVVYRHLALEGRRWGGKEAAEIGLVDGTGGLDEVLELVKARGLVTKGDSGVYGQLKEEIYRVELGYLDMEAKVEEADVEGRGGVRSRLGDEQKGRVRAWESTGGKLAVGGGSKL